MKPRFAQSAAESGGCAVVFPWVKKRRRNELRTRFLKTLVIDNVRANSLVLAPFCAEIINFLLTWTMPRFNVESIEVFNLGSSRPSVDCALSSLGFFFLLHTRQQHQNRGQERHSDEHTHPHSDRHHNSKTLYPLMFGDHQTSEACDGGQRGNNDCFAGAA